MLGREIGDALVAWGQRLVSRLEGMHDAEYLWEPVADCWSVRKAPNGDWLADVGPEGTPWTDIVPPPLTTIAWRMWHLGASPSPTWPPTDAASPREFADRWFNQGPGDAPKAYGTAEEAIAAVDHHWATIGATVAAYEDDELLELIGDVGGPYGEASIHGLVLHVADELIHHSAEIALLRDLYRAGHRDRH